MADESNPTYPTDPTHHQPANPSGDGDGLPVPRMVILPGGQVPPGALPPTPAPAPKPHRPVATISLVVLLLVLHAVLSQEVRFNLAGWRPAHHAGEYWRLLTSCFVHANWLHVGMNSLVLYQIGRILEGILGWQKFLALFLLSGLTGSAAASLASTMPGLGASGAIFGMIGMFAIVLRIALGSWQAVGKLPGMQTNIVLIVGINLLPLFGVPIGVAAHLGGLAGGLIFAWAQYVRPGTPNPTRVRIIRWAMVLPVIVAVTVASVIPLPWQTDSTSGSFYLYRAEQALEAGDAGAAWALLEQAGPPQQMSPEMRSGRLYLLLRLERLNGDEVGAELVALQELFPNDAGVLLNIGFARYERGEYRLATDVLTRAQAAGATDWQARWFFAESLEMVYRDTTDPVEVRELRSAWQYASEYQGLSAARLERARQRVTQLDAWLAEYDPEPH